MLSRFGRSLRQLTNKWGICALLINSVVGVDNDPRAGVGRHDEGADSTFEPITERPALGKSYATLIDLSLYTFKAPRSVESRRLAANGAGQVEVLEVLRDRKGCREGRWATFSIEDLLSASSK